MEVVFAELAFDRLSFGLVIGDLVFALFFSLPFLPSFTPLSCGFHSDAPPGWLCEGVTDGWMQGRSREGHTGTAVEGY